MRLIFLVVFFLAASAEAYQEMIRHGYFNCTACHISPTGAGVLTEYGRALSKDVMSTWGKEGEEKVAYGLYTEPEWLRTGANFRIIQTYVNNPDQEKATAFPMQAEVEVAALYKDWTIALTGGIEGGRETNKRTGKYGSPSHYAMYRPTEMLALRAGKFKANYGLNLINHAAYTESDLAFGPLSETYNVEFSYQGESVDFIGTALFGGEAVANIDRESGFILNSGYALGEKSKLGVSYLRGHNNITQRNLAGLYAVLTFSHYFYLMSEYDIIWKQPLSTPIIEDKGVLTYNRLNYEWTQGLHIYVVHQLSYLDLNSVRSRKDSYGLGAQFFPRPHFEFNGEYYKERNLSAFHDYYDVAWLLFHYYL